MRRESLRLAAVAIASIGLTVSAAAEQADSSPLSANGYIAVPISAPTDGNPSYVYSVNRVTDPSTINPGEPMPGYPNTDVRSVNEFMLDSVKNGSTIVFVPGGDVDPTNIDDLMASRAVRDGVPILVQGGATVQ